MITLKEKTTETTLLYQDRTQKATISTTSTSNIIEYFGDCIVKSVRYATVTLIELM